MDELYWLIIGVEDGWIAVNNQVWQDYLMAKEQIKNVN